MIGTDQMHDALTIGAGWRWPVFPCIGKRPATPHGFHDATADADLLAAWWLEHPRRNVAVATGAVSGLVVIDIDPGGFDTLRALSVRHGGLPDTLTSITPRGGRHLFFRHPGVPVPCSAGKVGTALDVRGDGGYIILPPSEIDGRPYRWAEDPWPGPPQLAALPEPWLRLLTRQPEARPAPTIRRPEAYASKAFGACLAEVEAAPIGQRNATLYRAAARCRDLAANLQRDAAVEELERSAVAVGLDVTEARRTIISAWPA